MEEKPNNNLSERDRKMAERFTTRQEKEYDKIEKADADDDDGDQKEKSSNRRQTKIPRKGILGLSDNEIKQKDEQQPEKSLPEEKKHLFSGILRVEKDEVEEKKPEAGNPHEAVEVPVEATDADKVEASVSVDSAEGELNEDFQELVIDRIGQVERELESVTDLELPEVQANAEFLADVGERIEEGMEPEAAINDALIDMAEVPETEASPDDLANEQFFDIDVDNAPLEDEPVAPLAPTSSGGGRRGSPPPTGGHYYTSPPPPITPMPPPRGRGGSRAPHSRAVSPDLTPMNDAYYHNRRSGDILLGGIVGYMIGRRGGRKRTEARLEPEIKSRDKNIEDLRHKLGDSEAKVRALAAEKTTTTMDDSPREIVHATVDKLPDARTSVERVASASPLPLVVEKEVIANQEKAFEGAIEESTKFASVLPERTSKEVYRDAVERKERVAKKDVRSMTVSELLEVADHIMLEKTSLRDLYEHRRIDAVNLRRVVIEYMNGGSRYETLLRSSLAAVEMQRELRNEIKTDDPVQTNVGAAQAAGTAGSDGNESGNLSNTILGQPASMMQAGSAKKSSMLQDDDRFMVSNGTAIVVGVLVGIAIMIILLITSR